MNRRQIEEYAEVREYYRDRQTYADIDSVPTVQRVVFSNLRRLPCSYLEHFFPQQYIKMQNNAMRETYGEGLEYCRIIFVLAHGRSF